MWIEIICSVIVLIGIIGIGQWIYNTINTKNMVEYYPNGRVRLKGKAYFNKRIGIFEVLDEEGRLTCKLTYHDGEVEKEAHYNPMNGLVWKVISNINYKSKTEIILKNADDQTRDNKEIVLIEIRSRISDIQYISDRLKNDIVFILDVIEHLRYRTVFDVFQYLPKNLTTDKNFILEAIKIKGDLLQFVSLDLRGDPNFMLEVLKISNECLTFTPEILLNDKNFILEALNWADDTLYFASVNLRSDPEVILEAIKKSED